MQVVLGEYGEGLFESLRLAGSVFRIEHLSRREMRAHALKVQVFADRELFAESRQAFDLGAKAVHAGIDFQVHGKVDLLLLRSLFQAFDVPGFPNRGREIVGDDAVLFALPDAGHEEDTGPDAGAAQGATFRGVGDTEPRHAFSLKREGAFDGSVAVTIGLDHRTNGYARADVLLYGVKILSERT